MSDSANNANHLLATHDATTIETGSNIMASDSGPHIPNPTDVMKWAKTQPFTNILLILILGAIAWVSHHLLTVSVPSHLQQIQDGYERIDKVNREDRALIIQQYDKWFEYIQKRNGDPTGQVTPENIIPELWRSHERDNSGFSSVVGARGIAHSPFNETAEGPEKSNIVEITTPEGIVVTWRDSSDGGVAAMHGSAARSQKRGVEESSGRGRRGNSTVDSSEKERGRLLEFAKSKQVF
jgi:hypothetical protein